MSAKVEIANDVLSKFPDLNVVIRYVRGVKVSEAPDSRLEKFKEEVFAEVKRKFTLEGLKDEPVFRAYRDFFWKIGIDPTKVRPAAEALIRRILGGRSVPRINTAVDAYNLASISTCIAIAAFDLNRLDGNVAMRFANRGESFMGIGMDKAVTLTGGEIIMSDRARLIAIYPYKDADYSKITIETRDLMLVSCGVPGVQFDQLKETADKASDFVTRFCGNV